MCIIDSKKGDETLEHLFNTVNDVHKTMTDVEVASKALNKTDWINDNVLYKKFIPKISKGGLSYEMTFMEKSKILNEHLWSKLEQSTMLMSATLSHPEKDSEFSFEDFFSEVGLPEDTSCHTTKEVFDSNRMTIYVPPMKKYSYNLSMEEKRNYNTQRINLIVKALTKTLKKFPSFNSSIDQIDQGKMTLKKYFHIGIAVDTPHGLMVPKLRNADKKDINSIAKELKKISDECRNLRIDKKDLFGGSMTITSLGGIGGSFFTPIINFPEVAILGTGKSQKKQVYINGKFAVRTMLPLSLSYDHRIIDGAEAARFNNELRENLGKNFAYKLAV